MNFGWRSRARNLPRAALLLGLAHAACRPFGSGGTDDNSPAVVDDVPRRGDGRVFVAWTLGGAAPSEAACAGVDHLELRLDYGTGGEDVRVAPIPCSLDRFRYDALPVGTATLTLRAVDANGCALAEGTAAI